MDGLEIGGCSDSKSDIDTVSTSVTCDSYHDHLIHPNPSPCIEFRVVYPLHHTSFVVLALLQSICGFYVFQKRKKCRYLSFFFQFVASSSLYFFVLRTPMLAKLLNFSVSWNHLPTYPTILLTAIDQINNSMCCWVC